MTTLTLRIDRDTDLKLLLDLVERLNIPVLQKKDAEKVDISQKERQKMVNFIMAFEQPESSFGDAGEWQRQERTDRELPWSK